MKNVLFATTALVALGSASAAFAAEPITASVRGYMLGGIGYGSVETGFYDEGSGTLTLTETDDFGVMRDGEIHFRMSGASDNGLTFSARVELEAFTTGDQIDENWVAIGGDWGEVKIGGDDHASYNLATGVFYAPYGKIGHYDDFGESDLTILFDTDGDGDFGESGDDTPSLSSYISNNRFSDTIGIHYSTPNFSGFQAQVSYFPSLGVDGGSDGNTLVYGDDDAFSIGANYRYDGGDFAFQVSGGYDYYDAPATFDEDGFMVGAQVEFYGFAIGGFFKEGMAELQGADEEYVFNASYDTGPWGFGLGYSFANDMRSVDGVDRDKFAGWVTYDLMPGVVTALAVEHTELESPIGDTSGTVGMLYMGLSF